MLLCARACRLNRHDTRCNFFNRSPSHSSSSTQPYNSITTATGVQQQRCLRLSLAIVTVITAAAVHSSKTAAGVQNPQGVVHLSQSLEGSMRLLLDDEEEYNRWKGASTNDMVAKWLSPYKMTTTDFQTIYASMNSLYFEDVSIGEDEDLQILETDFATINDANTGLLKLYFKNTIPPSAYS